MRIGLLSDTHIPVAEVILPSVVTEAFHGVDLILHAGDIFIPSVLDKLQCIAPVLAARGDDDYGDTLADERVKQEHTLEFHGIRLQLIHERPYSYMSISQQSKHSAGQGRYDVPDIIVFGDEHRTVVERHGDTLLVNPGSPTLLNYRRGLGTVAMLDIDSGKTQVRILQL